MAGLEHEPTDAPFEARLHALPTGAWAEIWSSVDAFASNPEHPTWEGGGHSLAYPLYSAAVERLRSALRGTQARRVSVGDVPDTSPVGSHRERDVELPP